MGLTAFNPDSPLNGESEIGRALPDLHLPHPPNRAQAVTELLQGKYLNHTYGVQREWEVRTTLVANRQAWHYRSCVLVHGKEVGEIFSPIHVDRTRQMRQAGMVTEEMLTAFANEAVEVHFSRCASVEEYSLLASIYAQPLPRRFRVRTVTLSLLCVAALAAAYWLWFGASGMDLERFYKRLHPNTVLWQSSQVSYHYPSEALFVLPLPSLERKPATLPIELTVDPANTPPAWLELDRQQLSLRGTAPRTAEGQTYRLVIRAHTPQGGESRLYVSLTITGQPAPVVPDAPPEPPAPEGPPPRLRGHWTW
jgi:hypothetical protein